METTRPARVVKFRVFSASNGMYYPDGVFNICTGDRLLRLDPHIADDRYYPLPSDDLYFMQFTGLQDDNGQDIYEGDIIRYTQHLFNTSPENFPVKEKVVKWLEWEAKWNLRDSNAGESNFEVIGNVYENPELIQK